MNRPRHHLTAEPPPTEPCSRKSCPVSISATHSRNHHPQHSRRRPRQTVKRPPWICLGAISSWVHWCAAGWAPILKGRDTDLGRDLAIKVLLDDHERPARYGAAGSSRRPRSAASCSTRASSGLRAGPARRRPAVLHHEAGQGPHAGRPAVAARTPRGPGRSDRAGASSRSSSRSARRWPMPMPAASSTAT